MREWKKLNSKELGITNSMISRPTRKVLNNLKQKGIVFLLLGSQLLSLCLFFFSWHIMRILWKWKHV